MAAAKLKYSFNFKDFFLPHLKAENKHDTEEEFWGGGVAGDSKMAPFANWQRKNKSPLK